MTPAVPRRLARGGPRGGSRLARLGIAKGAGCTGAVHSGVRKALSLGISREEIEQVVALTAGTLGMPSAVVLDPEG